MFRLLVQQVWDLSLKKQQRLLNVTDLKLDLQEVQQNKEVKVVEPVLFEPSMLP